MAFLGRSRAEDRERLLAAAERRGAYDRRDPEPCDISILPRVVGRSQAADLADVSRRIVQASIERVLDIQAGREQAEDIPLAWIAGLVERPPATLLGNVRLDFLLEDGRPRLLETGWVNLSGVDYAPQAALALLDCRPALAEHFRVERPAERMRERLGEQGIHRLAILVKDDHTVYAANDFALIREVLRPIDTVIVSERDFAGISGGRRGVVVNDLACDAVYLRSLDGPAAFSGPRATTNRQTLERLLASDVVFHDHPLMLLAEDKDLGWLIERDPSLAAVVPRTVPAKTFPETVPPGWVLKLRDRHSGEGVFLDPEEIAAHRTDAASVLQERITADPFPVLTVHGHEGEAVTDLAVHLSYRYDVAQRRLEVAEIAGYFSRFSLTGGKVNLCAGGGIVPVLSERDGRMETADAPADT